MDCPHCKKSFVVPDAVYRNAESYGGRMSHVVCRKCKKAVLISSKVHVVVEVLGKGDIDKAEPWR